MTCIFRVDVKKLKVEKIRPYKTLVTTDKTTGRHNVEGFNRPFGILSSGHLLTLYQQRLKFDNGLRNVCTKLTGEHTN